MSKLEIRRYKPGDMERLYRICLLTGKDGYDASGTVDDRILGHCFAAPYATFEPDLCFVLADNGVAIGYILGTSDSDSFAETCETGWWPELREQYPLPEDGDQSRMAMLVRTIHSGYQSPALSHEYPAHLHIDILPAGQGQGYGRKLIERFCERLREYPAPALHFGVSQANDRAVGFYKHLGFHVIEESRTSYIFGMQLDQAAFGI
jgi:ribosomal protein S18 acetylase RimI-like enzyme